MSEKNIYASQDERRQAPRLLVEDYFSLCIILPDSNDSHAARIVDISNGGLKFLLFDNSKLEVGSLVSTHLYVNNTLYLPLELEVLRVGKDGAGCKFTDTDSGTIDALKHFLAFLQIASSNIETDAATS